MPCSFLFQNLKIYGYFPGFDSNDSFTGVILVWKKKLN